MIKHLLLYLLITHLSINLCYGQFNTRVDITPVVSKCADEDITEIIACSESFIQGYFLNEIDQSLCPTDDTNLNYEIELSVNKKGVVTNTELRYPGNETNCSSYFESRLAALSDEIKFVPARLNRKEVDYKKTIVIQYPTSGTKEIKYDPAIPLQLNDVDVPPRFLGCEDMIGSEKEKELGGKTKMLMAIYSKLKYPPIARDKRIQGTVLCQFVINQTGLLENIFIENDIGGGCGKEVLKVIKSLNDLNPPFRPGYYNGQAVKVIYILPINFKLG